MINQKQTKLFIGERDFRGRFGEFNPESGVYVNSSGDLVIVVESRVTTYKNHHEDNVNLFVKTDLSFYDDDETQSDEERTNALSAYIRDGLFVFDVIEKVNAEGKLYGVAKNVTLIPKNNDYKKDDRFEPIPLFSAAGVTLQNRDDFEHKLLNQGRFDYNEFLSNDTEEISPFVIWKDDEDSDTFGYLYDGLEANSNSLSAFLQYRILEGGIHRWRIPDEAWIDGMIEADDIGDNKIAFVPSRYFDEDELHELLGESENLKRENLIQDDDTTEVVEDAETVFLRNFKNKVLAKHLRYNDKDLINFHTALKTSNLTILSGLSGTGKTKIVEAYAEAVGMNGGEFTVIPVRPFWQDDSDVLGYPDTVNSIFRPGDSGLVDLLVRAADEQNKMFLVLFDEMNLARVEHYFSQFLSILEQEQRVVHLYNDKLKMRLYNYKEYPSSVKISNNVLFVGTVNIDESTFHFSDKVLDRANVIELDILPFNTAIELPVEIPDKDKARKIESATFLTFKKSSAEENALDVDDKNFLWNLHVLINGQVAKIGIGWRIVNQIDEYLKNLPKVSTLSKSEALDLQIKQRVLTKLRGSEDELKSLLGTLNQDGEVINSTLLEMFEKNSNISSFEASKKVIKQKAKEISLHGYAI